MTGAPALRLGAISLWGGPEVTAFRDEVRLAESLGYEVVGVGDSPAGWHDLYVALTVAALETERAIVTPMVTTPHLRHPIATTLAVSALQDLTGGRAMCTFGAAEASRPLSARRRPRSRQCTITSPRFGNCPPGVLRPGGRYDPSPRRGASVPVVHVGRRAQSAPPRG